MDKLRALETFVKIVDGGSLTAAASALDASLPSVVRQLAALEAAVEVRLLNRTTRRLSVTDEGREYYERARRVLAEVEDADAALKARRREPRGTLRLTASVLFGRMHVAPAVLAFGAKHPAVHVDLLLLDRSVDLVEEGIDLGVRIGPLPDSSLVAVPVGSTPRYVCATPGYLAAHGRPASPRELGDHRIVGFTGLAPGHEWRFRDGRKPLSVRVRPTLSTNQIDVALEACRKGLGLGQFLGYQVRAALESRSLVRVLQEHEPAPVPVHIVYPASRGLSANVRAMVDWLAPRLRRALAD